MFNGGVSDRVDAWVRGTCERCGTVQVRASEARLVLARPHLDGDLRNQVEFRCRSCGGTCSRRVDDRTTRLVTAAGVVLVAAPDVGLRRGSREPEETP